MMSSPRKKCTMFASTLTIGSTSAGNRTFLIRLPPAISDPDAGESVSRTQAVLIAACVILAPVVLLTNSTEVLALAYVVADETLDRGRLERIASQLARLDGREGYFTEAFCRRARYLQPANGMRVDAIRDAIDGYELSRVERGMLLTTLLLAADRALVSRRGVLFLEKWTSN